MIRMLMIYWLRFSLLLLCIILFSELDDHGLLLKNLLGVSSPSVCGILASVPSGTLGHCGNEEGGGWRRKPDSTLPMTSLKSVFYLLVAGLLLFQHRPWKPKSIYQTAGTAVIQRWGGRRRTSSRIEPGSFLLLASSLPQHWRVSERPLPRMPHTDGD